MRVSAVVCTHNRPADLARCLAALARERVEVVVVDSCSTPPVSAPGVRLVRVAEPGLSRARNAGLAAASGELVAFVDDDAEVEPGWAAAIAAPFEDARVGCVGGACFPAFAAEPPRWLGERLLQYAGVTRFRGRIEVRARRDYPFGANVCFRREALQRSFPEALGRTGSELLSGEEVAVVDAVRAAGWRVVLEPSARVHHHVAAERLRSSYYWRRLWWQGVTRARAEASLGLTLRLLIAAPVRMLLYLATRDRVHLYRTAETAGYVREILAR